MAQATNVYRRSMSASVGSGLGSVIGGSGRQYYILEHKNNSKFYKVGESQEIIVDQIEIGRDPKCQVYFDETFKTVSRRHAAIVRDGDMWKLVQLSNTNPTFLNGTKVEREWYLQNGDEIQLSYGGPKLGFIQPVGKKAMVGSIKMSRRVGLLRQQVWKPYSTAILIAGIVIFLGLIGFAGWRVFSGKEQTKLLAENVRIGDELDDLLMKIQAGGQTPSALRAINEQAEILSEELNNNNMQTDAYKSEMDKLHKKLHAMSTLVAGQSPDAGTGGAAPTGEISNFSPFVFAIMLDKTVLTFGHGASRTIEEKTQKIVGTGFQLDDGRFITARHILEPWYFFDVIDEPHLQDLNMIASNGGSVVSYFTAISSTGKRFSFNNANAKVNRATDRIETVQSGKTKMIIRKSMLDNTNWASIPTHETSNLRFNNMLSSNLEAGTTLEVLGFAYGKGAEGDQVTPRFTSLQVANSGFDAFGTIRVSNDNTIRGNDGGPVLVRYNGAYHIIGVLPGSTFAKGRIVPVSATN